ncbi:glycosyltransferase [Mariniflexile sp.]|uniref:glycosyltransferase n=1 Tax=Mariniflexile sp. TaxID=1979402 RepID=UPI003563E247
MTHILHITETFATGVYVYLKDLTNYFDNHSSFKSTIIYSSNRVETEKSRFHKDFSKNVALIEVNMVREISPILDFKSVRKIISVIGEVKPDIIHCHSSKAGIIGKFAAILYPNIKVFYTPHGYSFLREDLSPFKKKLYYSIEKLSSIFLPGTTIACGDTEYEYAKKLGKSHLVRNGVNISELRNFALKNEKTVFTVGTVGRISFQKNPELFNKIAELFPKIKFVWVGNGVLHTKLLSENIEVTGWKTREDVIETVNSFDVYIQTSFWEGLPITILEAMALEKPIIATNVIGNKDAVKHGENGYLCDSLNAFQNYINKLIKDDALRNSLGLNSLKRATLLFDKDKNFEFIKLIYQGK